MKSIKSKHVMIHLSGGQLLLRDHAIKATTLRSSFPIVSFHRFFYITILVCAYRLMFVNVANLYEKYRPLPDSGAAFHVFCNIHHRVQNGVECLCLKSLLASCSCQECGRTCN